jgi:bifunctional oligoribonuclease and PAP phosphatase NrnA
MSTPSGPAYTSTLTIQQAAAMLKTARSCVILTHTRPDGDALGSSIGLARAMAIKNIKSECWFTAPMPAWADQVIQQTPHALVGRESQWAEARAIERGEPDLVVIVDTGSWVQIDELRAFVESRGSKTLLIDHHISGNAEITDNRLIITEAASCSHIIALVVEKLLDLGPDAPLPGHVATPLYLGLATDTGWLRFSNVKSETLRMAARLVDSGVDHPALYEMVEQQNKPARPKLLGFALSSLTWIAQGKAGIMTITDKAMNDLGTVGDDTGGFAEPILAVAGAQIAAVLTEMPIQFDGLPLIKVSLRSKPGPKAIDVAKLASQFGGGGHARAAGIKFREPLEAARSKVVAAITAALK